MLLTRVVQSFQAEGRAAQRPERGECKVLDQAGRKLAGLELIAKGRLEGDGVRGLAGAGSCGALGTC